LTGYYMYIEASSPRQAGDYADLHLFLSGSGELACLKFYYQMYGEDMGTLTVFSGNDVVFNASGNHGNYWKQATKNIYLRNSDVHAELYEQQLCDHLATPAHTHLSIKATEERHHPSFPNR